MTIKYFNFLLYLKNSYEKDLNFRPLLRIQYSYQLNGIADLIFIFLNHYVIYFDLSLKS